MLRHTIAALVVGWFVGISPIGCILLIDIDAEVNADVDVCSALDGSAPDAEPCSNDDPCGFGALCVCGVCTETL